MYPKKEEDEVQTTVSFRIFSPELSPEEVTKNVQIEPNHMHHNGDLIPGRNMQGSTYKHGMWSLESKISEKESLENHLDNLLSVLEPNQNYIKQLSETTTIDFYCVLYSQSAFLLSPQVMKRMGDMGITFGVVLHD